MPVGNQIFFNIGVKFNLQHGFKLARVCTVMPSNRIAPTPNKELLAYTAGHRRGEGGGNNLKKNSLSMGAFHWEIYLQIHPAIAEQSFLELSISWKIIYLCNTMFDSTYRINKTIIQTILLWSPLKVDKEMKEG